jgi:hypothetical protein
MNLEKVVFGFFVVLAATLNFGFFIGNIDDPDLHNPYELFAAVVVNLIATCSSSVTARRSGPCTWPPAWSPTCS